MVSIANQGQTLFRSGRPLMSYVVSTGRNTPSCVRDSGGTPDGLFRIAEKHGAGLAPGMVLKGRRPIGRCWWEIPTPGNLVTSRILWLDGLEPGHNHGGDVDTYSRYIYLHGTNREDRLGHPASAGCVVLANRDIIALHDAVDVGDHVLIF